MSQSITSKTVLKGKATLKSTSYIWENVHNHLTITKSVYRIHYIADYGSCFLKNNKKIIKKPSTLFTRNSSYLPFF